MPRKRLLIVEDETVVAMDIERGLTRLGYEVVASTGQGEEAIRLADQLHPDLVLMDIRLQGAMDGIQAGQTIRRDLGIPIVFLTAYADTNTVERAKLAEPFGYLLKPFEDNELHTVVEIALHKRQTEQETMQRTHEALRQSEERFQLLVESLQDYAVFLLDPQGRIITWNRGAQRIKGYPAEEVLGQHFSLFYRPEEVVRNVPEKVLWRANRDGRAQVEGWRVRKDGSSFWADVVITALRDTSGKLLGFAKITRDITQRKLAEDEIRQLNASLELKVQERTAELRAANQELEAFASTVAHDLRAPLRGICGFLFVLQEELGPRLTKAAAEYLSRGQSCAKRMNTLIDELLSLARVGQQALKRRPTSMAALVREVMEELGCETCGQAIDWKIEDMPVADCDPSLMKLVYQNLLSNACKYSKNQPRAAIHVGTLLQRGETIFFVRDNGVGFNMAHVHHLFQPFSRLHGTEFQGTGVGLATVERIIRRHGGRVWAEAEEGQGATFYFSLGPAVPSLSTPAELPAATTLELPPAKHPKP
jgi:PAS domain S-box-containing protein